MTKKERIAELERRVAELEQGRLARDFYNDPLGLAMQRCPGCGTIGTHACMGPWWRNMAGTSGTTSRTPLGTFTVIGAAS